ncbi:UDP-glycosyltransferase UGT5-like isoform X2 [Leptopilina boulardi]|uniref:UDP-glycosyltransferase UGT5-like isoform X2 n=1 Tax=Leptopilina boulardi TaxID=63433 RepID=UPI0021F4FE1F|nr:UDP-glycosyltransferase UGT5-like isoform X2 [Leptopilina boulardi]
MAVVLFFVLFFIHLLASEGFKILGICPSTSYSHQQPFQAVMKALANKGHQVTVISPITQKEPIKNYSHIDVSFTYRTKDCTKLRNSNKTFDAIIIEQLWFQCYYALVKRYNFPLLIGFLSVGNLPYAMDSVGNPDNPLLNADMAFAFNDKMTLNERLWNVLYTTWTRIYFKFIHLPQAQIIANKYIPGTSVFEVENNFSLVILGNNHIFGYPKPLLPNVVEVHSLHINDNPAHLPQDIQEFLDNAPDGVIYFSLGSNLQSDQLSNNSLTALYGAFRTLKQKILWKHTGIPTIEIKNIKFIKWAPQQTVLAHKNTKVFMMQGGLQSLQEAVYYGVPLISIPFFGDQLFNTRKIIDSKIGLSLEVDGMTSKSIVEVVEKVLQNSQYVINIKEMSAMIKDEMTKPIDKVVWNIEHLLKFPKAPYFSYRAKNITWLEYYGTIIIIIFITLSLLTVTSFVSVKICRHVFAKKLLKNMFKKKVL